MSTKEIDRVSVLEKLMQKEISQKEVAGLWGITTRQVRRTLSAYRKRGTAGVVHQLRGKPSNNQVNQAVIDQAIGIIKTKYFDFGPVLAFEKLTADHGFPYSRETLRLAMIDDGIYQPGKIHSSPPIHLMRDRRPAEGEMVQVDGSWYSWLEERGPAGTLLVFIDDATGKLKWLEMVDRETTRDYFRATRNYLTRYGKPLAFYLDRHGVFRVNTARNESASVLDSNGLTQFGRAMAELGIEMIYANSPQAKGRVERVNQTLQDRLVKELRLVEINTCQEANQYLPLFMEEINAKFAVTPKSPVDVHRPIGSLNLDDILIEKHRRVLSKQLIVSFGNIRYQITEDRPGYALRKAVVEVRVDSSKRIGIFYHGKPLSYRVVEELPKSALVMSKDVNPVVDRLKRNTWKPAANHPWKRSFIYQTA